MSSETDAKYWAEYSNLQQVKHDLIHRYLGGWFAKLGSWAGRVLYVDTHAGRGRHRSGKLGSPLVALKALLEHHDRDRLLRNCEFRFHFVEKDPENYAALEAELRGMGELPRNISVSPHLEDAFAHLTSLLGDLRASRLRIAPAFIFVDPYGFKISGSLLRELMAAGRVELFVNLMWRELGMAISQRDIPPAMAATLNQVFDGEEWRTELVSGDFDARAERAVNLLARKIGGHWQTFIRMLGDTEATRYLLVHLSNHDEGRDLMKEAMWKVCPGGGFFARKSEDPAQQFLISPEPDLRPLREWVISQLRAKPHRWSELHDLARPTIWRVAHVNEVIRALRKETMLLPSRYEGKFLPSSNPLLTLEVSASS